MAFSGTLRRHRVGVVSSLVVVLALVVLVLAAVSAEGYKKHEAHLNDGGIWVTNSRDGFDGRVNKPIGQLDGAVFEQVDTQLDVVQDGAAVVGWNVGTGVLSTLDPSSMAKVDGDTAALPGAADVQEAGGTLAVLDTAKGDLWAERVDTEAGLPTLSDLDAQAKPLAGTAPDAALAVTQDGTVLVASADDDTLRRFDPAGSGFGAPVSSPLGVDATASTTLTAVGDTAVTLDPDTGRLHVVGGPDADVPQGSALQSPGPDASSVLVGTPDRLVAVDLESGAVSDVATGVSGRPTQPVRLGACAYGAWSGGQGAVATQCGTDPAQNSSLASETSDLVFRVNRGQILLNDRSSGAVWNIDSTQPTRLDDWDAFKNKVKKDDKNHDDTDQDQGDRRPPRAKPDDLGARLGRTTVLHPLDNDTAPEGRLLAISSVEDLKGSDAHLEISPDGQTVQITMPSGPDVGVTTFDYTINDGREDVSAHALVTVHPRDDTENADPELRDGFKPTVWNVPSGGTLDVPVLPDWRDKTDGDPLTLASATAVDGDRTGAVARTTAAGRVRFTAPAEAGTVTVKYGVTDGIGDPVTDELKFQVQDPKDRQAHAAVAEPDVVSGEAGKPITIRPLDNDEPGSDPVTPDAQLQLAGKVAGVGGATVKTDLVDGTITFTSPTAHTYFLDYDAKYGNAPFAAGRIRVDVAAPSRPPQEPVAVPDSLTLYGQTPGLVDVLANDVDPAGGLLVVQSATADVDNQLDVAVVGGRYLRIAARQGQLLPNPQLVRYTISNGTRSGIEGQVVVSQRPTPADDSPVTETDRVVVRAGGAVSVPVLDNDFSPTGDALDLVTDVSGGSGGSDTGAGELAVTAPGDASGPTGSAFVSGRFVRYVAPPSVDDAESYSVRYYATNAAGDRSPGTLQVQVIPASRRNQPPEPPTLEGRVVAGDTVKLRMPGAGVDPDGDPVTLTGIASAPGLGRVVRYGADSLRYQSYPTSVGTDTFTYTVSDSLGATATGTVRIAVVPPGTPQPPLAVPDTITTEPGRVARVDPLANDDIAAGDRVSISLVGDHPGVDLAGPQGPITITAPAAGGAHTVSAVYKISDGLASSQSTVTLRTAEPFNNPPVVFDAFGDPPVATEGNEGGQDSGESGGSGSGSSITVDVLQTAYDPDGDNADLKVSKVFAPPGVSAEVHGGNVTVQRGDHPLVVPFKVTDGDGGSASASIYVPPRSDAAPYVKPGALIRMDSGAQQRLDLGDYVVNPSGGPVRFTLQNRVSASPSTSLTASISGDHGFEVTAAKGYRGPGAVSFEVTTGTSVDDPDGVRAVLTVPVQVGSDSPILRCPDDPIQITQDQTLDLDVASICHVWTPDPDQAERLSFDADWESVSDGLGIISPQGSTISVNAAPSAAPGSKGTLLLTSGDSDPGRLRFVVVKAPPPSLAPIRVDDMQAGQTRTIDLAPYLTSGVKNPQPTIVSVSQVTGLDVSATSSGSRLTLRTGPKVDGHAEFSVTMSDVAGSTGPERQVKGRVSLDVLDVPDAPTAPVPGNAIRDAEVVLGWRAPEANGAPIDRYEVRGSGGVDRQCPGTACDIDGLTNGKAYTFQVRAHNAVGWSDWSASSSSATPDTQPGLVGPIKLVKEGDRTLTIAWTKPTTQTSEIKRYRINYPGGNLTSSRPQVTVTGLDNDKQYQFSVAAENLRFIGEARTSDTFQSIGNPGTPAAPTVTDQKTPGDQGAVTLRWPEVDPNGPSPVRYTVQRNGSPLAACTNISATTCDNSGIDYDGTTYTYKVTATNKNGDGKSSTGAGSTYKAVGVPEAWGAWTVAPTGENAQAKTTFTVPDSNGGSSQVKIYVDGAVVKQLDATGNQNVVIGVPDNDGPHSVKLEVCNEAGACSTSDTKTVQTYGPLTDADVLSVTSVVTDKTKVAWRFTVDANGDPATVRITSNKGRNQTFTASSVDVSTFTSSEMDLGYSAGETVTVTISDGSPNRGSGSKQASVTTVDPPPPTLSITQGSRCNDGSGGTPCQGSGNGGEACTNHSCARIQITSANFPSSPQSCTFYDNVDGAYLTRNVTMNTTTEPGPYYGYGSRTVWVRCAGTESNHYNWPND